MTTPNLDLTDPTTVEKLKAVDVLKAPFAPSSSEDVTIEKKIRGLRNASTFKLKLTAEQLTKLERDSASAGYPNWQAYLQFLIDTKIFDGQVGAPLINKPSFAKNTVSGPSLWKN
jgi:hypothetical protein